MKSGGGYTVRFGSVTDYIGVLGGSFEICFTKTAGWDRARRRCLMKMLDHGKEEYDCCVLDA